MSDIPKTDTVGVAQATVAWEITKTAYSSGKETGKANVPITSEDKLKNLANAYIKAYQAISSGIVID